MHYVFYGNSVFKFLAFLTQVRLYRQQRILTTNWLMSVINTENIWSQSMHNKTWNALNSYGSYTKGNKSVHKFDNDPKNFYGITNKELWGRK